jgi:hypothetical protein
VQHRRSVPHLQSTDFPVGNAVDKNIVVGGDGLDGIEHDAERFVQECERVEQRRRPVRLMSSAMPPSLALVALCGENATLASMPERPRSFQSAGGSSSLRAWFTVSLPGLARDVAQSLVDEAHKNCPYSKAPRGNIDVAVTLA